MKTGIIIQARTGSTRLPKKMLLPFCENENLLDIAIAKAKSTGYPVVLATSNNQEDKQLKKIADQNKILFFAGDENNVLKRFIDAAEAFNLDVIIRYCADNPFIQADYIAQLIKEYEKAPHSYISFFTDNDLPSIKTHYGFFTELVELKALRSVYQKTSENIFLEHVTNYIYTHPEIFKIKKVRFPFKEPVNKIRLTIDTEKDFEVAAHLFKNYSDASPELLIEKISENREILNSMHEQVVINSK